MTDTKTTTNTKKTAAKAEKTEKALIGKNTVLTLTIDKKTAAAAYKKTVAKLSKDLKTSGFRKGKVPVDVAEKMLGEDRIIQEALEVCVPDAYKALIEKEGKQPLTYPEFNPISLKKGEDWTLEVHIAEKPVINLKGYKAVAKKALKTAETELKQQAKDQNELNKAKDKTAEIDKLAGEELKKSLGLIEAQRKKISEIKEEIESAKKVGFIGDDGSIRDLQNDLIKSEKSLDKLIGKVSKTVKV